MGPLVTLSALDRPVAFHRVFVTITGSVTAALQLSQLLYWWSRRRGETVYKTREEWFDETGLSPDELRTSERKLKSLGIITVKRIGVPPKNHYILNEAVLTELINESCSIPNIQTSGIPTFEDRESLPLNVGNADLPYTETTTETTTEKKRATRSSYSRKKENGKTFKEWMDSLPEGEEAIPLDHHVFKYAERIGMPYEFLEIAWFRFQKYYSGNDNKRYLDWPQTFRNSIEGRWGKLWYIDASGEYHLTTDGEQQKRDMNARKSA